MPTLLDTVLIPELLGNINNQIASLVEGDRQATLRLVNVAGIPLHSTLIKSDESQIRNLFRNIRQGILMRCDYLLISNEKVFFIEMKSSPDAAETLASDCIKKFKAVKCIVKYFDNVLLEFHDGQFFNQKLQRFVLLHHAPSINKTATRLGPLPQVQNQINDTPENFKPISVVNGATIDISLLG